MPADAELSDEKIASVNRIIGQAENVLLRRGVRRGGSARFADGPFALSAFAFPDGRARVRIEWRGAAVFDVAWPVPGDVGRLMVDEPGAWREALFAIRALDS